VHIRPLSPDDLPGALALSTLMGWNQRGEDWRRLTGLAPSGSFVALDGDRVVGTAIGIDYGGCGWIAMMLVEPGYRGRGLGARLLETALGAIPAHLPARLDATPLGRPLYERYGFVLETALTRFVRPATAPAAVAGDLMIRLAAADLSNVAATDAAIFGGSRPRLLERIHAEAPEYAWRVSDAAHAEYCLGRYGRLFDQIGPIVAATPHTATELASAALAEASGKAVVVDAYNAYGDFTAWLQSAGFEPQRPLYRMRRETPGTGAARSEAVPVTEFAILGPEFG
jgi:GNAT superfamily N-acetyltransferase